MIRRYLALALALLLFSGAVAIAAPEQLFLLRHVPAVKAQPDDLSAGTETASYKPLFGVGDKQADLLHGVVRFGELTVEPGGASATVNYPEEEQIYYILEGEGTLRYGDDEAEIKTDDFMYLPTGVDHGIANPSAHPVRLLVMGWSMPDLSAKTPAPELQIANANQVEPLVLGSHGPTTTYKLLMGTTESTRDRLAAAHRMVSLFIMEFLPTGTNKPHQHATEEEIYCVLRGHGTMVAGVDAWGNNVRHPCQAGDAFYFAAGTRLGFYSGGKEGEENPLILAVRSTDPVAKKK